MANEIIKRSKRQVRKPSEADSYDKMEVSQEQVNPQGKNKLLGTIQDVEDTHYKTTNMLTTHLVSDEVKQILRSKIPAGSRVDKLSIRDAVKVAKLL